MIFMSFVMMALASSLTSTAQVSITSLGTPYTQNFDGLSNDTVSATNHPMTLSGWAIFERGTSAAVNNQYKVNIGASNAGDVYSYGSVSASDRALGSIASGTNSPAFGVVFQNNTGGNITDLNVSYRGEQWRSGDSIPGNLDSVIFEYSTTATGIDDTVASWTSLSALMLNTLNLTTTVVGAIDGNATGNFNTITGTISVLIPNGGKISLRWRDINKAGGDDGLAVDDLSISFQDSGNPRPSLVSTNPVDNSTLVSPSLTSLTMTFDQNVTMGTGNIKLINLTDATSQTIACSTTTIAGAVVTIPGIALLAGKSYAVNFDSTCYTSSTSANSYGIYDSTSWDFATQASAVNDYSTQTISLQILGSDKLSFSVDHSDEYTLSMMDMNGRIINRQRIAVQSGTNNIDLSGMQLHTGLYIIRLSNEQYSGVVKFEKL
jgi:hypothetical protein